MKLLLMISAIDEQGITITIVGYIIVMVALVLLSIIFSSIPKVINFFIHRRLRSQGKKIKKDQSYVDGEVSAAIATAIHLYLSELHDEESNVITIKKIAKRYTPWSSKIYNMNSYYNRYRN